MQPGELTNTDGMSQTDIAKEIHMKKLEIEMRTIQIELSHDYIKKGDFSKVLVMDEHAEKIGNKRYSIVANQVGTHQAIQSISKSKNLAKAQLHELEKKMRNPPKK